MQGLEALRFYTLGQNRGGKDTDVSSGVINKEGPAGVLIRPGQS